MQNIKDIKTGIFKLSLFVRGKIRPVTHQDLFLTKVPNSREFLTRISWLRKKLARLALASALTPSALLAGTALPVQNFPNQNFPVQNFPDHKFEQHFRRSSGSNLSHDQSSSYPENIKITKLLPDRNITHGIEKPKIYFRSENANEKSPLEITLKCGAQGVINGKIHRYVLEGVAQMSDDKLGFYKLPMISLFESSFTDTDENKPVFVDVEGLPYKKVGCDGHYCISQSFYHPHFGSTILFNIDSDDISLYIRAYDDMQEKILFISGSCSF